MPATIARLTLREGLAMRKVSWWSVAAAVALAALVLWLVGTWLFRMFIRLQGGH